MRTCRFFFTLSPVALLFCASHVFADTIVPSACDAVAGNLIVNCGFEWGNFNRWTVSNPDTTPPGQNDGDTLVEPNSFQMGANSGDFFAALGNADNDPTTVSQTFSDIVGTNLTFSFYYAYDGNPHSFTAEWNGSSVFSISSSTATAPQGYTLYSFDVTGSGSDTISFLEKNVLGFDALDDVVVTDPPPPPVPEPSSLAVAAAALGAVMLVRRLRSTKTV